MRESSLDGQRELLLARLNYQREHVLGILDGLGEADLRRSRLPSGWTPLGLVQHLTLDVERFWFRAVAAGEPVELASGDAAWQVPADVTAETVFGLYRREIEQADSGIAGMSLSDEPAWWPADLFDDGRPDNLLEAILHVISETAVHAGHLDAVRELIDGRTWLVLTEQ